MEMYVGVEQAIGYTVVMDICPWSTNRYGIQCSDKYFVHVARQRILSSHELGAMDRLYL